MLAISPVHRRLAELNLINRRRNLTPAEMAEVAHCLHVNAEIVRKLDELKQLSMVAYTAGDMDWQHEICRQIDEIEVKLI